MFLGALQHRLCLADLPDCAGGGVEPGRVRGPAVTATSIPNHLEQVKKKVTALNSEGNPCPPREPKFYPEALLRPRNLLFRQEHGDFELVVISTTGIATAAQLAIVGGGMMYRLGAIWAQTDAAPLVNDMPWYAETAISRR